jgi:hypothetical protein
MPWTFNPFSGTFDQKGSGGGGSAFFAGEVATYADLPLDGTAALNSRWLVRTNSGTWPFSSYKQSGIYIRTATVGSSRDNDYKLTDTSFHDVMSDDAFLIFDNTDPTKAAKFDVGAQVGANQTRVITVPNKNITLDDAGDSRTPSSHTHGNLTNDGKIGTTANLPLRTGTNGVVEAGSFGTAAGSFCEGNDARLSDDRDPNLHAASHLAGTPAIAASYTGIGDNENFSDQVTITANTAGTAGNNITLTFDGVDDVDTVIAAWNSANPSNQATLDNGDGSQVPDGDSLQLSGGVAAIAGGSDPVFDQDLNATDDVQFATIGVGDVPTGSERKFHQHGGKFTVESADGGFGQFQILNPNAGEVSFVMASEAVAEEDGTVSAEAPENIWAFGTGSYSNAATTFVIGNNSAGAGVFHILPDGKMGLGNGNSDPAEALDVDGNIALRDTDNDFTATFDVQSQLSDDVTLTIPDQSGTIAVVTDIPTTASDISAAASGSITTSGLTQATARILGRTTASTGAVEEITVGSGLSLSAGQLSATASGGSKTYAVFTATDNQPTATAFATLDTRNSIAVLDFDDASTESAVFVGIMPEGAVLTSGLIVNLDFMATTATSGNVRWSVAFERCTTDLDSDSFDTATAATVATSGTSGIVAVGAITCTAIDGITAGDLFRLRVQRIGGDAADTASGDIELVAVELRSAA